MRKYALAVVIFLGVTIGILSAEMRLQDGTQVPIEVIERRDGRILVKSEKGQAWIPETWQANDRLDVVAFEAALNNANTMLEAGDTEAAYSKLIDLVSQNPGHVLARRSLAKALRWRGRFEAASFLIEGLLAEAKSRDEKPDLGLLIENAELAVLSGDQKAAKKALSALKADRGGRDRERALSRQLNGGKVATYAKPPPVALSEAGLSATRKEYNADLGSDYLAQSISQKIQAYLEASPYIASGGFIKKIYLTTKVAKDARADYETGGDEDRYALFASEAGVVVAVDRERWLALYDWQKKLELEAIAQILRWNYPNAICRVHIMAQRGEDEASRYTVARVTFLRGGDKPQVSLETPQNLQDGRGRELARALEDFQENHRSGR